MTKKPINLRLDFDLVDRAKAKANSDNTTLTSLVEQGLELVLDNVHTNVKTVVDTEYLQKQIDSLEQRINSMECKDKANIPNKLKSIDELLSMNRDELRKYAHSIKIPHAWKMGKADLISKLSELHQ